MPLQVLQHEKEKINVLPRSSVNRIFSSSRRVFGRPTWSSDEVIRLALNQRNGFGLCSYPLLAVEDELAAEFAVEKGDVLPCRHVDEGPGLLWSRNCGNYLSSNGRPPGTYSP